MEIFQDYEKYKKSLNVKKNIKHYFDKFYEFEKSVTCNIFKSNKYKFKTTLTGNYYVDLNLHQDSFLYRIFYNYEGYIKQYGFTISNSFKNDDIFEYQGGNPEFKLRKINEENIERNILLDFYKNFLCFFPNENPISEDKNVFIYNFLVFLCANNICFNRLELLDKEKRLKKFYNIFNIFKVGGLNNVINNELEKSNHSNSPTKNSIIQYFSINLF